MTAIISPSIPTKPASSPSEQYLTRVVFYQERSFTHEQFRDFMFAQSEAFRR